MRRYRGGCGYIVEQSFGRGVILLEFLGLLVRFTVTLVVHVSRILIGFRGDLQSESVRLTDRSLPGHGHLLVGRHRGLLFVLFLQVFIVLSHLSLVAGLVKGRLMLKTSEVFFGDDLPKSAHFFHNI